MNRLIVIITLVLLMSIMMIGCSTTKPPQETPKLPQEPPKLTITIGEKQIAYVVGKNIWNGYIYDREGTFQTIMRKGSKSEIPYIGIGSTVTISFTDNPPSKFTISDILIDETGDYGYSDKEIISIPVELKDGKGSFEIKKHLAAGLSSYYVEGKTDLRGFRMIATWGENECEYAFIIRTDSF